MVRKIVPVLLLLVVVLALAVAPASAQDAVKVRLQLKWVTQAQFAGYYAALGEGYYSDAGLDVEILPGGPDIGPQQVVASGSAEFGIDWIGSFLAAREGGADVVHVAQVFQSSGMREVTWKDSGLASLADLKGKVVGVWGFGNEIPLKASLLKNNIDPDNSDDVTIFNQPFDMNAFLNREIDAAAAMTYNELAQVLEFVGEDGKFPVYTLDDLNVIDLNQEGSPLLEDLIFANGAWLADNEETAIKFLAASFEGWIFCRDNPDACVQYVLDSGSTLGAGHQTWMMNEINKLVWPSPNGVGMLDEAAWKSSVESLLITKDFSGNPILKAEPSEGAFRTDLAEAALASITDMDTEGVDWEAATVEITANGE
ncbi:MAG: ABC transporter substrate-binding protein [Anaerolineae bacterium]